MKRFVIGDIHGAHKALVQVLERCGFDKEEDQLICLGDVCDGWPHVKECIDELMTIKNLVYLWANHDEWAWQWMVGGEVLPEWWTQGGKQTFISFFPEISEVKPWIAVHQLPEKKYADFFKQADLYHYIDDEVSPDTVFVHGGFNRDYRIEEHRYDFEFTWDRNLFYRAVQNQNIADKQKRVPKNVTKHNRVFLGHTAIDAEGPKKFCEVWNMDTGAGWNGVLSIMNIDTEEYWTSDPVMELHSEDVGRR